MNGKLEYITIKFLFYFLISSGRLTKNLEISKILDTLKKRTRALLYTELSSHIHEVLPKSKEKGRENPQYIAWQPKKNKKNNNNNKKN